MISSPSLFDELEPEPSVTDDIGNTNDDALDDWVEVSQAHFLSWSTTRQLHYCWRRDLDSALRAENADDAAFFLARAADYKQELESLLVQEKTS